MIMSSYILNSKGVLILIFIFNLVFIITCYDTQLMIMSSYILNSKGVLILIFIFNLVF